MASHFSSIGFNLTSMEDFKEYFRQAYENGEEIKTSSGTYIKWTVGEGIELWGQLDNQNTAIGLNPHFSGKSSVKISVLKMIRRDEDILDGGFYCWADPGDSEEAKEDGSYPFVFDLPDIAIYENQEFPFLSNAQIVGFAHNLEAFENVEAFNASQQEELKIASMSFFPIGLYNSEFEHEESPRAIASFTGHIIKTRTITNPVTGVKFLWALVETYGGIYDIVADPLIIKGEIVPGGIASGTFWLSGRLFR